MLIWDKKTRFRGILTTSTQHVYKLHHGEDNSSILVSLQHTNAVAILHWGSEPETPRGIVQKMGGGADLTPQLLSPGHTLSGELGGKTSQYILHIA